MSPGAEPGLAGKVAIVAGEPAELILEVVASFATNRMPIAVVTPDRTTATAAATMYDGTDIGVIAVTADPADSEVWRRVAPHAEQRLGPIDVIVLVGSRSMRELVVAALLPDMAARKRGVIIEISPDAEDRIVPPGVHHYALADASAVAAAARCGSR